LTTSPSNGKYSIFKEGVKFTEMDKMLLEQAKVNELAEANRLKRLELEALHIEKNIPELATGKAFEDHAGYVEGWDDQKE
jgi:hypothetical protein